MHGMRPGQPPIQVVDPRFMHHGKSKTKGRHDDSSTGSSDEWESESGSSNSEPGIRVRNVESGDYRLVGKKEGRGRGKHSKASKKSRRHRSESRGISRSRSRSRATQRSSRRRRDSDLVDLRAKHSPTSSGASSPKLPPINIFMPGGKSSGDERGHRHRKRHDRRDSVNDLPANSYNKRKYDINVVSQPMGRRGSKDSDNSRQSWGPSSESSFVTSSVNTGEDSFFDKVRRPRAHHHSASYSRQHPGSYSPTRTSSYTTYDGTNRRDHVRDRLADDYPYGGSPPRGRDSYPNQQTFNRPLPHRRATLQDIGNPFDPLQPGRYPQVAAQAGNYPLPRQLRYSPEVSPVAHDRLKMDELAGALLDHIKKDSQRAPLRRRHTERMEQPEDEWENDPRYQSSRGAGYAGGYGRY